MSDAHVEILATYPTRQDLFDLTTLAVQLYAVPAEELDVERNVCDIVDNPDKQLFVARTANIIGALVSNVVIEHGRRYCLIGGVVVDDAMRGQGIAASLVEAAITHGQQQGLSRFDLTSRNSAAQSVYARLGFEPYPTTVMRRYV